MFLGKLKFFYAASKIGVNPISVAHKKRTKTFNFIEAVEVVVVEMIHRYPDRLYYTLQKIGDAQYFDQHSSDSISPLICAQKLVDQSPKCLLPVETR